MYKAQVKNKQIIFSSDQYQDMVLERLNGKRIKIMEDEDTSPKLRRFFEGPVVHYFFYQHEPGTFQNFKDARESLKLEFNPIKVYNIKTGLMNIQGGSTQGKSLKWWSNANHNGFLDRIEKYFNQHGYEYPDSTAYNEWLEREAPSVQDIYPPLIPIIKEYKLKLEANVPVWRR